MALSKESLKSLLSVVPRFVKERLVLPRGPGRRRERQRSSSAVIDEMKAMGLFGMSIPEEHGDLD